ncbi:hypothetical protein CHS0354_019080 [Potamilus streckersoni]|uniref:C-type lectin domain-containing protein n=1 Tax=Potamilus streckersoni TaxID=2493646 RepID=A0AAE0W8T9_9BIVA|nr:hypothetical protein CHS0354_019080 [Potamilus streckersoni]
MPSPCYIHRTSDSACIKLISLKGSIDQCPKGLTHDRYLQQHGYSCYEFVLNHPGDWFHAEQHCEQYRGFLVHIQSAADQAFIYQALRNYNLHGDKGVWIGFTDTQFEGNWKWSSGDQVTYTYWSPGQPSVLAGGLEDCGLLDLSDGGHWHDYPCHGILFNTQNHGWICQYGEN